MADKDDFDFFEIDEKHLDREWFRQAQLVYDHCRDLAEVREKRDRARAIEDIAEKDLKEAYARIYLAVKKSPETYGLDKVTEGTVDATVLTDSSYKLARRKVEDARQKVIDCDKEVGILEAVVKALEHKRPALEAGVKLWSASYFGEPSAKNAGTTAYKVNEAKADKALGKRKRTDDD